jgi:uncharacterized protein
VKVLISGASGLIGSALSARLQIDRNEVVRLVRYPPQGEGEVFWNPMSGSIDAIGMEGMDAVVHLAGENIAGGRWTEKRKQRFRESRVGGTQLLCSALAQLAVPPRVLVCASAIGYYGHCGDRLLNEEDGAGEGFLAGLVRDWEGATEVLAEKRIRVVLARFGVVLSAEGGALAKSLLPFRLGLGGKIGDGRQYMSWIALEDAVGATCHALACEEMVGPMNVVGPEPATNAEFTRVLGKVLKRPTLMPLPAGMARLMLGEMADELLLASIRVAPTRLMETGYEFLYPELEGALRHLLEG